ncbi:MAG: CAAX amino terminal protease self-immunity [uncultured Sulfurovum sp.]|uniref:CAAX amino terminal protease self-immunity n=1 Tax=uncultured Sulfurovum sp. TaxID=269237 RepID=A0A6S6TY60_9BACT|nr:MAG: CAAX amino terminal protease self-immunity [uncultured Sulfurovum sp.]
MQNSISTETGKVWGFRGTFLWGLVILLAFALGQVIPLLGYMFVENMSITLESFNSFSTKVTTDAFLLFLSAVGGMFLVVPVVLGIAKLKKGSILKEYFSLNGFTLKVLGLAILAFVVLQFSTGLLIEAMGAKEIPNFMMNLEYPTLMTKILLVIAVVVAAPIVEEVIFRGFLLKGFSQTFMGVHGAVFVTAVLWAVIHQQYEIAYLIAIFVIGLVFGYARVLSNSLYIPMIMHALMNFLAIMGLFYAKGVF